ncbi:5160_t:CDS:1, partial [Cetraspora pellucida]
MSKIFHEVEEMLQDKQKDIDALILVNNFLSTEFNYYKTHWFSKLFDKTSNWLKDLIIDFVDQHTSEPLRQFTKISVVREYLFNFFKKFVSLRTTSIV